ncbi:uncharacterized protein TRIADDRAFT_58157 [Trichoplax adhaerens]|uniref:BD-FAE-like domain-containing protein n=1 Tax=Trichoplax adhaerens TaxID=10228 RepID=B3S113_TRIAD|nr:hypothetical protein TRIADDRAFT_58157 [Trichoplax adhaerens]EDV23157.1 hypothetical protein TRIADDRAFT_58157 [Trichoplax adhaerens]|eukprot:XP_002114067.1 hypothetical protein TRIADDRAFT_58157 [Trichoplax adhaerens]
MLNIIENIGNLIRLSSINSTINDPVMDSDKRADDDLRKYTCLHDLEYNTSANHQDSNQSGTTSDKQMLDLYLPKAADPSTVPIVVFVHGGGWRRGDRKAFRYYFSKYDVNLFAAMLMVRWGIYENVGKAFARSGIACAVVSYRLSRLKFPYLILELLSSFLMTMAIICWPILAYSWVIVRYVFAATHFAITLNDCLMLLWSTTPLLFVIFCLSMTIYPPPKRTILLLPLSLLLLLIINYLSPFKPYFHYYILYITTTIAMLSLLQTFLMDDKVNHRDSNIDEIRHPTHVNDVALSVKWLTEYGKKTKLYNPQSLYLCGHSAGGHIISLLSLDQSYLNNVGVQSSNVKAAISISGVYDLGWLSRSVLKQFYLNPAFGNDPATWVKASPYNHITRAKSEITPPFLIINPKHDFLPLLNDANRFMASLRKNNFRCKHFITPNRNHLTIMKEFGLKERPCCGNVEEMCILFIYQCEANAIGN